MFLDITENVPARHPTVVPDCITIGSVNDSVTHSPGSLLYSRQNVMSSRSEFIVLIKQYW